MLTSPLDHIIVKLDKAFEDEIVFASGVKLFKDTQLNPEWSTTCTGKVVSVPNRLSKRHELKGLAVDCKAGDEIIFSYMVVFDMDLRERDTPIHHNLFYHEGEFYWKVDYHQYFGKINDGKIIPAQGYVFLEELEPEKKEQVGLIWMPEMVQKEKPKGRGRVIGVGGNKSHEPKLSVNEGDIVRYSDRYACKYEIKGKNYVLLQHYQVLATENA